MLMRPLCLLYRRYYVNTAILAKQIYGIVNVLLKQAVNYAVGAIEISALDRLVVVFVRIAALAFKYEGIAVNR